ncbi:cysteine desulfurase family protein [Anaeromicrobium sediminis]|uniref:cysteine desulfurase n=1 Tax=Anaeromicrobium sediminis TaxID=1478221 RepID=A0A267MLQ0_9FIRM|nr:cysteine desulfurase family protein [Anaeromicrobium sediminis]PAB60534.1 cysteine desulfurase DndA [Anaeromicrobium sediminis]
MIYLDNNATTPIDPEVFDAMEPYLKEEYGNPSSKYYLKAENAKKAVEKAREQVASLINSDPTEIIFTGGASESNNFIIKGVADYQKFIENSGNHIITSKVEHKAVLQTCKFLNGEVFMNSEENNMYAPKVDRGYEVTFLDVNEYGQVSTENLSNNINDNTILTSLIWGNNEIGSLNDILSLAKVCKEKDILFHSDATQVLGKLDIDISKVPVDFLSFSAHKLYGPKGVGAAFIRSGEFLMPDITALIHGGSQEYGYRAGTHAVHNIVGFGKACEIAKRDMNDYIEKIKKSEIEVRNALKEKFNNIVFLGDPNNHIPGTISFILPDKHNELYIKQISDRIAISSGSACSINEPSYVLDAIGRKNDNTHFFRMSIGKFEKTIHNKLNSI